MQFGTGLLYNVVTYATHLMFHGSLIKEVPMDLAGTEIFKAVTMKIALFWDLTPCRLT
jgi:hypothetical protein